MLTAGATHGLHLVATTILGPNAVVFIEDPTYFLAITMLRDDFGMKIVPGNPAIYFQNLQLIFSHQSLPFIFFSTTQRRITY